MTDNWRIDDDFPSGATEHPEAKMTAKQTQATMSLRADAVRKHRAEGGNGPEMSDETKQTTQSAIERIRSLFRGPDEADAT